MPRCCTCCAAVAIPADVFTVRAAIALAAAFTVPAAVAPAAAALLLVLLGHL